MIGFLKGEVVRATERILTMCIGGIGYEVAVTRDTATRFHDGEQVTLWTHLAVREDAQDLYGFMLATERDFFRLLLTVSGIGPKSALNILDVAKPDDIRSAVAANDPLVLHKLHGLGKKTAERLVTELKDKVDALTAAPAFGSDEASFIEAITGLGYSLPEAREALKQGKVEGSLAERVKQGIKFLSRQ